MPHVTTPHFAATFRLDGAHNAAAVNEQDTGNDVAACVEAVLRYTPGFRLALPEFGVRDQTFFREPDIDEIQAAIDEFEPRASATVEDLTGDLEVAGDVDEAVRLVRVALEG